MTIVIDLNKLMIIFFVGICAVLSVYMGVQDVPALCLGGLIGYLSKDYHTNTLNESEVQEINQTA